MKKLFFGKTETNVDKQRIDLNLEEIDCDRELNLGSKRELHINNNFFTLFLNIRSFRWFL